MWQNISQVLVILCSISILYVFASQKYDITGWILFISIICSIISGIAYNIPPEDFFNYLPISSLIYLIFMDIFIKLLIKEKIFEYFTLKIIRHTKENIRLLFYLLCISSALISGIMEDVSMSMIMNPIIFKTTRLLKIDAKPYLLGTSGSIILGNLITPVATPTNIIFSTALGLDIGWFLKYIFILFIITEIILILYLDRKYIKHLPPVEQKNIEILLEIMVPRLLIRHKKRFFRYITYLIVILIGLIINFYPFLYIAVAVTLISLIEERGFTKMLKEVNWELPFLFIGLYLYIACLRINGITVLIQNSMEKIVGTNIILGIILLFIMNGIIASYLSRSLSLIIMIAILNSLFQTTFTTSASQTILGLTLLISMHLAGNMVPQSNTFLLKTLDDAKKHNIGEFNYNNLTENLKVFTMIGAVIGIVYIFVIAEIIGVL